MASMDCDVPVADAHALSKIVKITMNIERTNLCMGFILSCG